MAASGIQANDAPGAKSRARLPEYRAQAPQHMRLAFGHIRRPLLPVRVERATMGVAMDQFVRLDGGALCGPPP